MTTLGFLLALGLFGSDVRALVGNGKRWNPVHVGGTTLQETVLFEIFLSSLIPEKGDIAPVELCGMNLRRPLARRRNSEVFSMIVSLTAQTTAGLGFSRRRPRKL